MNLSTVDIQAIISSAMILLTIAGVLVCLVHLITQVVKNLGPLKEIHTNFIVVILSVILTLLMYFIYVSYTKSPIVWYLVVGAFFGGFVVAYIAMFGWNKLIDEWKNSKKPDNIDDK
jgi:amino acid permease